MIPNLFSFHGADYKVGTTMISQSIAMTIARSNQNMKVLFVSMNGRENADYLKETPVFMENLKIQIENHMLHEQDFLKSCKYSGNFYVLAGPSNELEVRYYYPEGAAYLLNELARHFDLIIADSGNDMDNGLAIGALQQAKSTFFIVAQQETGLRRYEKRKTVYHNLGIDFSRYVVNKYIEHDPYDIGYLTDRLQTELQNLWKVSASEFARRAEMDRATLMDYKNDKYSQDIIDLSNSILIDSDFPVVKKQRKNIWRNFI